MRIAVALLGLTLTVFAGAGQGPVKPGPIVIDDLNMGTYWYGAKAAEKDLRGKVVLVEMWGS